MTSLLKIFGKEGLWGAAVAIAAFLFYSVVKRSTLYKQEKKKNQELIEANNKIIKSIEEQSKREKKHDKKMDQINSGQLNASDYSRMLSSYPNRD